MSLDTRPPRQRPVRRVATARERQEERGLPSRSLLVALVLACLALMVVDKTSGDESPISPVRRLAGEVLGPAEAFVSSVMEPVLALPGALRTNDQLRERIADLEAAAAAADREQHTAAFDAGRRDDRDKLCKVVNDTGYVLAPAHVNGYSSAQSFSNTVTIDAGTDAGLRPDMTVLNGDGLVGRILAVTSHTATVLLIVDPDSTVGGKVGANLENGLVDGRGGLADDTPLELRLLDNTAVPQRGEPVVTWGSADGTGPYVTGVPIGEVSRVYQDLRAGTYRAVLEPYVDFTSLGDVGVVVPAGGDRRVIDAEACS